MEISGLFNWLGRLPLRQLPDVGSKIKVAAGAELISTAVGTSGPERQPKEVLELHGGEEGMEAAMKIAEAV